jgi:hypothetical protein
VAAHIGAESGDVRVEIPHVLRRQQRQIAPRDREQLESPGGEVARDRVLEGSGVAALVGRARVGGRRGLDSESCGKFPAHRDVPGQYLEEPILTGRVAQTIERILLPVRVQMRHSDRITEQMDLMQRCR